MFHVQHNPTNHYFLEKKRPLHFRNVFVSTHRVVGTSRTPIIACIAVMLIGLYGYHIHYLTFVNFDYGYNMTVNVAVGKLMVCNDSL